MAMAGLFFVLQLVEKTWAIPSTDQMQHQDQLRCHSHFHAIIAICLLINLSFSGHLAVISLFFSLEVLSFVWFYNLQSKCAPHEVKLDWVSNLEILR